MSEAVISKSFDGLMRPLCVSFPGYLYDPDQPSTHIQEAGTLV